MSNDRESRRTQILEQALELQGAGDGTLEQLEAAFPADRDLVREVWGDLESDEASRQTRGGPGGRGILDSDTFALPREIGRFAIQRLLGRGGQGEVYEARDRHLDRLVALKVLSRRLDLLGSDSSDRIRARFRREAESAARLDHPGICAVHDSGIEGGVPWIAMQLVRGHSLMELIIRRRANDASHSDSTLYDPVSQVDQDAATIDAHEPSRSQSAAPSATTSRRRLSRSEIEESVLVVEEAARALHASHRAGLIHRDVKPGNIMVTENRRPVILDFGLAADEKSTGPAITVTGDFLGSPAYMSPEQAQGHTGQIDRRTDVYGLGVTLFECLTLRRPFQAPSRELLLRDIATAEPPSLRALNPQISRDLEVVVHCALEKSPDRRYDSAEAFAEDLRRVRDHEPILARPSGPLVRLNRWRKRNPVFASLFAALLVFASVFAVWSTLKQRELRSLNFDLETLNQDLGSSNSDLERVNGELNGANQRLRKTIADYERMADVRRLANAEQEARSLWPIAPNLVSRLEAWQERYAPLAERLPQHIEARDALRKRGSFDEKTKSWDFGEDFDAAFRHEVVDKLVRDLTRFSDTGPGRLGDISRRLSLSRRIGLETLEKPADDWRAAAARVAADPRFDGFELKPVSGLVPLGQDPKSGLEEFLHWSTHAHIDAPDYPERNDAGDFTPRPEDGVILVLIPGGPFLMGSQNDDPKAPNYAPADAIGNDLPAHMVRLDPYFIAKYEFTQAQWLRCTGQQPSYFRAGTIHPLEDGKVIPTTFPVERVSCVDAQYILNQLGLTLPTEAQWERAARAGTTTMWPGTSDESELSLFANVGGAECLAHFSPVSKIHRDPFVIMTAVGTLKPNAYGLHDVIGNVFEWARDQALSYTYPVRDGDGLRTQEVPTENRMCRGGSFRYTPADSLCATRFPQLETTTEGYIGFRAAFRYPHE